MPTYALCDMNQSESRYCKKSRTIFTQKMVVVCVLGVGRLGGNIAGDLAFNGHTVRAWDNDSNNLDKLHERINYEKKRLKDDKIMTYPEMLVNILGNFD